MAGAARGQIRSHHVVTSLLLTTQQMLPSAVYHPCRTREAPESEAAALLSSAHLQQLKDRLALQSCRDRALETAPSLAASLIPHFSPWKHL